MKLKSIIPLALAGAALASCGNTQTPPEEIVKYQSGFKDAIVERYNVDNGTNLQSQNIELKGLSIIDRTRTNTNAKISFWEANDTITNMYVATVENYVGPSKVCDAMDYITKNASSLTVSYENYACPNSLKAEVLKLEHAGTNEFIKIPKKATFVDSQINGVLLKQDSKDTIQYFIHNTVSYKLDNKDYSNFNYTNVLISNRDINLSAEENLICVLKNTYSNIYMIDITSKENLVNEIVSDYTMYA